MGEKLLKNPKGSVTLFLLLTFTAFLFLTGIIIDVSRIHLARNRLDKALRATLRSVLASYDADLQGEFGLFAASPEYGDALVYFRQNLMDRNEGISLIDYRVRDFALEMTPADSLLNDRAFRKQVLEYMKYKGPLNITERVAAIFQSTQFRNNISLGEAGHKEYLAQKAKEDETDWKQTVKEEGNSALNTLDLRVVDEENLPKDHNYQDIIEYIKERLWRGELPAHALVGDAEWQQGNESQELEDSPVYGTDIVSLQDKEYRPAEFFAEEGASAFSLLTQLEKTFSAIALDGRDKLYIIEYIMDKYTYLTSATIRDHYFRHGEVEYILCGQRGEKENLLDAMGRILFLRFSLNTLDSFVGGVSPDIMVRLTGAVVEAFALTFKDILLLYDGEGVPLFPSFKEPQLRYSDHLRILLLLQDEEIIMRRMRQLIQVNIGSLKEREGAFKLKDYGAACEINAQVAINLWFLPMFHLDKFGYAEFSGNEYILEQRFQGAY